MIRRRNTKMDIVTVVTCRVVFAFLVIIGFIFYVEYEWIMR